MERKVTVHFHKVLQKYTHTPTASLAVSEYRELLSALFYLFPDLKQQICLSFSGKTSDFMSLITKDRQIIDAGDYMKNTIASEIDELWIVPSIYGQGKTAALVIGIALISIALFAIPAVAGTLAAPGLFGGYTALTGFAAFAAQTILGIGINLVLSFLLSMLMPKIDKPEEPSRVNNDMFEGLQITTSQNTPVPLNYGLIRHTGHLLSGSVGAGEPVTEYIPGRFFWKHLGDDDNLSDMVTSLDGSIWTAINVGDPTNESYTAGRAPFAFSATVEQNSLDLLLVNGVWYFYINENDEFLMQWAYKSTDGVNWTFAGYFPFTHAGVGYGQGKFVCVGQYNHSHWDDIIGTDPGDPYAYPVYTGNSTDGANWAIRPPAPGSPLTLLYGPGGTINFLDDGYDVKYWAEKSIWLFTHSRSYGEQWVEPAHIYRSRDPSNEGLINEWNIELSTPGWNLYGTLYKPKFFPSLALVGLESHWETTGELTSGWSSVLAWRSIDGEYWTAPAWFNPTRNPFPENGIMMHINVLDFATDGTTYAAICNGFWQHTVSFGIDSPVIYTSTDGSVWTPKCFPFFNECVDSFTIPLTESGFEISRICSNIEYDPTNGYWYIFGYRRDWTNVFYDSLFIARSKSLDTGSENWEVVYGLPVNARLTSTGQAGVPYGSPGAYLSKIVTAPGYYKVSSDNDNPFTATPMTSTTGLVTTSTSNPSLPEGSIPGSNPTGLLYWPPPAQTNPRTIFVTSAGGDFTASSTEDIILKLPNEIVTGKVQLTGGRHVRCIGGHIRNIIDLTSGTTGSCLIFRNQTGSVFIEGVLCDKAQTKGDAFVVSATTSTNYPTLYMQNCRTTGIHGEVANIHGDGLQLQDKWGHVFIGRCTIGTGYQGLLLTNQFSTGTGHPNVWPYSATIVDTNLILEGWMPSVGGNTLLWFRDSCDTSTSDGWRYPVSLTNVWVYDENNVRTLQNLVYPNDSTSCGGTLNASGQLVYGSGSNITGVVNGGVPSGGNFCTTAGLGYVSPGYNQI